MYTHNIIINCLNYGETRTHTHTHTHTLAYTNTHCKVRHEFRYI